jgi:23S rRNA pseudouridine1911/1915/1917 synthase
MDMVQNNAAGPPEPIRVVAGEDDAGQRLDRFLGGRLEGVSRSRVQALIRAGQVAQAGRTIGDPGWRVKPADAYDVTLPAPVAAAPQPQSMALPIVYEDAEVVVVDKPAGLVVHPAAGHSEGTLVNALLAHCGDSLSGIGGVRRPGIVHRLDKDTSGLLVVAKTDAAHRHLSEQFAAHGADGRMARIYRALVWGVPERRKGTVDAPLARSTANRTKIAVSRAGGARRAVTHYEVAATFRARDGRPVAAELQLALETGRTHQIRVHMAHIGHPLLGDEVYGAGFRSRAAMLDETSRTALAALGRQALHAAHLSFCHPRTGRRLAFDSALPPDLASLRACLAQMSAGAKSGN